MNSRPLTGTIDEEEIRMHLETAEPDPVHIREILARGRELCGLDSSEMALLAGVQDKALLEELFDAARTVKNKIYGRRIVLFAPLYVSNICRNECLYCGFRAGNREIVRKKLSLQEIADEVKILTAKGHKRLLLVAGENDSSTELKYITDVIETIYKTRTGKGEIRRVNVNIAPLSIEQFRELKKTGIGTYQIFQETYHRQTYKSMHLSGKKADYDWRLGAPARAMQAGIDDVGIGPLFGLYDWKFELLALMQHIRSLEQEFGVGPHTISVPRLEPASGSALSKDPPYKVSNIDFTKIVAILRLAVPYTGIIMSTRESPEIRNASLALGISQISAGSCTNPGGYSHCETGKADSQFSLSDHRELDEVIADISQMGYIPSFCTGCYRLGRTGNDFMDLARPGDIRMHCDPNAVSTFQEYLEDFASENTRTIGMKAIDMFCESMEPKARERALKMAAAVRAGKRDVYC
ncbi:MAG: [FeFe] hydrogenase H-cluster radical SAM maturase HydG [Fibrobacter sp.]|jgi:2-iminoacetate synthase|nr:[FeFe] hydrogenase H-cluster radical SAM maturase HydG [Fibrobacter sp.]